MLKIWTCYHYGRHETVVLVAETYERLQDKVREIIAGEWEEDQGPMPEDFDDLLEAYPGDPGDRYFDDFSWTAVDPALCEEADA